jgi:plasmid stabilization system protein ParE
VKGVYSLSRSAQRDIEDIQRYTLDRHGAEQAEIYLGGLRQQLQFVARFVRIGHPVPGSDLRMSPFEHHRIFYREASQGIRIERILHERRDLVGEIQQLVDRSDR